MNELYSGTFFLLLSRLVSLYANAFVHISTALLSLGQQAELTLIKLIMSHRLIEWAALKLLTQIIELSLKLTFDI